MMLIISNRLKVQFVMLMILISGCEYPRIQDQQRDVGVRENITKSKSGLPEQVKDYMAKNLPEWHVPDISDYVKSWWSFHDQNAIPYYLVTDVNDDEIVDYGVLVHNHAMVRLLFVLGSKETFSHSWAPGFQQPFSKKGLQYGLAIQPPGRIDIAYPEIRSLTLKSNAINLLELENRVAIYYFSDGKFSVFTTK